MAKKKKSSSTKAPNLRPSVAPGRVVTSATYNPAPVSRIISIPQGGFTARPSASLQVVARPTGYAPLRNKHSFAGPIHAPLVAGGNAAQLAPTKATIYARRSNPSAPNSPLLHDARNSSPTRNVGCKQRPEREAPSSGGRKSREFIPWCDKK